LVERDLGAIVLEHAVFADHRRFSERDFQSIVRRALACGAESIVVTEKDAAKIAGLAGSGASSSRPRILVTRLETLPKTDLKEFYEAVHRSLF